MDINTALLQFLEYSESLWMPKTMGTYRAALLRDFLACAVNAGYVADADIALLPIKFWIDLPAEILDLHPKTKTAKNYLSVIGGFLNWLVREEYIDPKISEVGRIEKAFALARRRKEVVALREPGPEDAEKIIRAVRQLDYSGTHGDLLRDRNISICEFLRSSGCRVNEMHALNCGEIDMTNRRSLVLGKGAERQRKVYFDQRAADALAWYWQARGYRGKNDPAWTRHDRAATDKRSPITTNAIRDFVAEAARIAEITFTPHYFRHAFAKKILLETGNLAAVQDLLGHKSANSTRVYATMNDEDLRALYREVFK